MSKRRILLADDSLTIQKVVNLTFADEGIEVVTVGDGDAAMEKFVAATPDLVMADINMPGLDGYRLCEMIKQDDETREIPVILLVGSFEPFDEKEAERVGANDFLIKPFQSIRQLVNKVSALLDGRTDENAFSHFEKAPVADIADASETASNEEVNSIEVSTENFGDAGMDDEMIQTAQIGSVPLDEIHKYESQPIDESLTTAGVDPISLRQEPEAGDLTDELEDEDWAKTQPLTEADFEEIAVVRKGEKTAPPITFDDFDLLDFPRTIKKETLSETVSPTDSEISGKAAEANQDTVSEISKPAIQTSAVAPQSETLSPESIEAIADRVVEKLSSKVIKRVVTEVLSQMERKR